MVDNRAFTLAAVEIAHEAGDILLAHLGRVAIEFKGEADLVTAADRASEALITQRLRQRFPTHGMIAEEGGRTQATDGYCWFVDPLDGTTNFAHRLPFFAVSIGLQHEGKMVAGVVFNPVLREIFTATAGQGAFLNDQPIHVSVTPDIANAIAATGFPSRKRHANPNIHFYHYFSLHSQGMRRFGSAALDLCYTACGRFDAFWEFNLNPWDTAAGSLILTEAGGRITDLVGAPYRLESPEVLASNGRLHPELQAVFADLFAGRLPQLPSAPEYLRGRAAPGS